MDILIYAKPERIEHKMKDKVSDDIIYCYWRVGIHPNLKTKMINKVYFSDGSRIFAQGDYIGNDYDVGVNYYKKTICFETLERVNLKQPKKPPTRGWCYING